MPAQGQRRRATGKGGDVMSEIEWMADPETDDTVFRGRISMKDFANLEFSRMEKDFLRMKEDKASDFLLAVAMVFWKLEEKNKNQPRKDAMTEAGL
jgi:hypothetical protein